jgi:hypothetical protein
VVNMCILVWQLRYDKFAFTNLILVIHFLLHDS